MTENTQFPYPMPEIRIQMRLNIVTDGGEFSMGPGGQMSYVGAQPPLPAIKSTPHIQQLDTSGDERPRRHHKHRHSKRSGAESDADSRRHKHRHRQDRDGRSSRTHGRSHRHSDREGSGDTKTTVSVPTSVLTPDESFGFATSNLDSTPEFEDPVHSSQPVMRVITPQPGFSELEPLDSDLPEEVSFNSSLINPPVVKTEPDLQDVKERNYMRAKVEDDTFPAEPRRRLAGYEPSDYRPYRPAPHQSRFPHPDQSVDSLEMSLDNRFEAFHGRLHSSNHELNHVHPPINHHGDFPRNAQPSATASFSHDFFHQNPSSSNTSTVPSKEDGSLVETVKSLLGAFEGHGNVGQKRSSSVSSLIHHDRPPSETEFGVTKPVPKPRHFGSHQNLERKEDSQPLVQNQFKPVRRTASQKSIETTFPVDTPKVVHHTASNRSSSPTVSITTHNSSYSDCLKPGILKRGQGIRSISPGQRSVETTFDVAPRGSAPARSRDDHVMPGQSRDDHLRSTRSREDIEKELAPMLANIEAKMRDMLVDQDKSLRSTVEQLSEKVKETSRKELPTPDVEKEMKPFLENLESKISRLMTERETTLNSSIQNAIQASNLQSKVDSMEKESQMKYLESRLERMFQVKEEAFRASVESILQNILARQRSPTPPPPPEPRAVEEKIVREQASPKGLINSIPYARSAPPAAPVPQSRVDPDRSGSNLNYSMESAWSQQRQSYYDVPTPVSVSPCFVPQSDLKVYDVPSDASSSLYDVPRANTPKMNKTINIPRPADFEQKLPDLGPALVTDVGHKSRATSDTSSPAQRPVKASSAAIFDMYTKRKSPSTISSIKTDSLMEENPDDYLLKDHFSPPTLAEPESTTLSCSDSLSSETSLRADRSAPFFDERVVRFRDDASDIESKLRQTRGSIASTTTTLSDVGIPLADADNMSDSGRRIVYYEEDVVEQVEYLRRAQIRSGSAPGPNVPFYSKSGQNTTEVYRSDSSASTNTLTGFGRPTADSPKLAKAVIREDPIVIMGDRAMMGVVNSHGGVTPFANSKPTEL